MGWTVYQAPDLQASASRNLVKVFAHQLLLLYELDFTQALGGQVNSLVEAVLAPV